MCVNISRLHCTDHQHIFAFNRIQSNTFGFQSVCLFVSSTFFIFIAIVWFAAPPTHRKPTTLFSSVIFLASHYFSFHSTQFLLTAHTHTHTLMNALHIVNVFTLLSFQVFCCWHYCHTNSFKVALCHETYVCSTSTHFCCHFYILSFSFILFHFP